MKRSQSLDLRFSFSFMLPVSVVFPFRPSLLNKVTDKIPFMLSAYSGRQDRSGRARLIVRD